MLALLIHRTNKQICYHIYKFYQKKHSLQLSGEIDLSQDKSLKLIINNSQGKTIHEVNQEINNSNVTQDLYYQQLLFNQHLMSHEFAIIVNKISHGGDEYNDITLLSSQALEQLATYTNLAPNDQEQDLLLSKALLLQFPKAKHYACFETGFHSTISNTSKMLLPIPEYTKSGIKNFGCNGLAFSHLAQRLHDITEKKTAKGKWVIIDLNDEQTTLCAVKNNKSIYCTSSFIHHELISFKHYGLLDPSLIKFIAQINNKSPNLLLSEISTFNLDKAEIADTVEDLMNSHEPMAKLLYNYYLQQISLAIGKLAVTLNGIHGIIFTGSVASSNSKLRNAICNNLEFLGVEISNKANHDNKFKLHKKNSKVEVYIIAASPLDGMLDQILERI